MKTIHPLRNATLVALDPEPEKSGMLYLPETRRSGQVRNGTILATGPGRHGKHGPVPMDCAAGQRVMVTTDPGFARRVEGETAEDGRELWMIHEDGILCEVLP